MDLFVTFYAKKREEEEEEEEAETTHLMQTYEKE